MQQTGVWFLIGWTDAWLKGSRDTAKFDLRMLLDAVESFLFSRKSENAPWQLKKYDDCSKWQKGFGLSWWIFDDRWRPLSHSSFLAVEWFDDLSSWAWNTTNSVRQRIKKRMLAICRRGLRAQFFFLTGFHSIALLPCVNDVNPKPLEVINENNEAYFEKRDFIIPLVPFLG